MLAAWLRVQVAAGPDLTPAKLVQEGGQALHRRLEQQTSLLRGGYRWVSLDAVRCVAAEELLEQHAAATHQVPPDVLACLRLVHSTHGLAHVYQIGRDMQQQRGLGL